MNTQLLCSFSTRRDYKSIIDIVLEDLIGRMKELGFELKLTDKAKSFLADKGYDPQFGARPLHRAIQKYLEEPISEEILKVDMDQHMKCLKKHLNLLHVSYF